MKPPPTRADVAADDGRFFGFGEMGERESVGGEIRKKGILVSKVLWLMLIEICLGVKMEKAKSFMVKGVNFPKIKGLI